MTIHLPLFAGQDNRSLPVTSPGLLSELKEQIYSAARADMEFRSVLPVARHYIENLLTAFGYAVCGRDTDWLTKLLQGVTISLAGTPDGSSKPNAEQIVDWFAPNTWTTQSVTNLSVQHREKLVLYTASYQTWDVSGIEPRCTSIGFYHGSLSTGPQVWRWQNHFISSHCRTSRATWA